MFNWGLIYYIIYQNEQIFVFVDKKENLLIKIRELSKDDNAFDELLEMFSEVKTASVESSGSKGNSSEYDGYFYIYFDPDDLSKISYSGSVKSITGYTNKELIELPGKMLSIIHPDDFDSVKRKYADVLTGSQTTNFHMKYRILSKQKKLVWINETFFIELDGNDNIIKCESIASDISEYMSQQAELEKKFNTLKAMLDERDKFINIISHDLRSPFTSLLGFSEILINEPNLPQEERTEYLDYIHDASRTQLQFINHLLDWSRLKTGKIKIEPKRLSLRDIVSNQISLVTRSAVSKDIDIEMEVDESIFVSVDERLIGETIGNLLSNGIKYSKQHKSISISAGRFKAGMIEVIVKDAGVGISESNQSKLFRIDQKYITSGTEGEKGSGMGLNLVKEIVDKHGGEVWFYSVPGEGSEFHFTIPEAQNIILIVEDDPEVRQLYKKVIDNIKINYKVIEAGNGYEAMSHVFSEMPSLVITDHDMPLMDGIQLIEAIRKRDRRNKIPIIVISAKFDDDVKKNYKKFGVQHLVPKPFDTVELSEIIKSSLI